jgi:inorganic pyrophosphatase
MATAPDPGHPAVPAANSHPHTRPQSPTTSEALALAARYLHRPVRLHIDRPLNSRQPVHGFRYEANYGYIPGTLAPDGEELDAYFLGASQPLTEVEGVRVAVIHREDDDDDKLIVTPPDLELSNDEIAAQVSFQERRVGHYRVVRNL